MLLLFYGYIHQIYTYLHISEAEYDVCNIHPLLKRSHFEEEWRGRTSIEFECDMSKPILAKKMWEYTGWLALNRAHTIIALLKWT